MAVKNNDKPLFFVFTCVKDGNNFIGKLFDRMLHQTKYNFIHYIYEDGSKNPLRLLLDDYKQRISKLGNPYKVIYEYNPINIGLNKATQHCISKCTCPYFIWIDCDNYIDYSFFEELEELYRRHKGSLLLRSIIYNAINPNKVYYSNCGTLLEAKSRHQLGLFIRRKYYYSLFAVNHQKYMNINPNNIIVDDKKFYNDEQVLLLCLLNTKKAPLSEKARGYFLVREGQESNQYNPSTEEYKKLQLYLCSLVSPYLKEKISKVYEIKELYNQLRNVYRYNFKKSLSLVKKIKILASSNDISLKNFYDYNLLKYIARIFYWRFRRLWKS